jgi:hypothetical protein
VPVFPPGVVLMAAPSQIHSIGAGVTVNTPVLSPDYGARCLVDSLTDRPMRSVFETVSITLDLGATYTPNLVGIIGHNIDHGRVIGVTNEDGLARGFGGRDPNCWLDLRGFPTTARYWTIFVNSNSVPVSMCEIVIATASVFSDGLWVGGFTEKLAYPGYRDLTEYLKTYVSASGALTRTADPSLQVDEADRQQLAAIYDEVLTPPGGRVLVVPNSRLNDLWYVEWPSAEEASYPNTILRTLRLPLYEPPSAVLNGR